MFFSLAHPATPAAAYLFERHLAPFVYRSHGGAGWTLQSVIDTEATLWFLAPGSLPDDETIMFVSLGERSGVIFTMSFPLPPHSSLFLISFFLLFSHISLIILAGPRGIGRAARRQAGGARAQSDAVVQGGGCEARFGDSVNL
jgi:hypothetical protein